MVIGCVVSFNRCLILPGFDGGEDVGIFLGLEDFEAEVSLIAPTIELVLSEEFSGFADFVALDLEADEEGDLI